MKLVLILIICLVLAIIILYSRVIDGFENIAPSQPMPRFTITKPIVPKKPPPSTNSNGGLVNIS